MYKKLNKIIKSNDFVIENKIYERYDVHMVKPEEFGKIVNDSIEILKTHILN